MTLACNSCLHMKWKHYKWGSLGTKFFKIKIKIKLDIWYKIILQLKTNFDSI